MKMFRFMKIPFNNVNLARLSSVRQTSSSSELPKTTCLNQFHKARGAKMELFAGYSMPIVYKSQTIISEHLHTRKSASVFDVSHMMQVIVRGSNREQFLEQMTVSDLKELPINRCTLSVFCNQSGGIIDDCIISKKNDHFYIVSNAGNADKVWAWLNEHLDSKQDVCLQRLHDKGLIALQGPKSSEILFKKFSYDSNSMNFMSCTDVDFKGIGKCQIARSGYTGEDGFEIAVDADRAIDIVERLCEDDAVLPAGLGARDTLRLEAGLCLHGNDITEKTTPVEAALSWTIHKRRRTEGNFVGADVILKQLKEGSTIKRVGLIASTPGGAPARKGASVMDAEGKEELGQVTSGTSGPSVGRNVAMAYLPAIYTKKLDSVVQCVIRGKAFEYKVARLPFVKANYYLSPKK